MSTAENLIIKQPLWLESTSIKLNFSPLDADQEEHSQKKRCTTPIVVGGASPDCSKDSQSRKF